MEALLDSRTSDEVHCPTCGAVQPWADVCRRRNVESIEDIPYGKGYVFALNEWRRFLEGLTAPEVAKVPRLMPCEVITPRNSRSSFTVPGIPMSRFISSTDSMNRLASSVSFSPGLPTPARVASGPIRASFP